MSRPRVHLGFCYGNIEAPFMLSVLAWERWLVAHEGYLPGYSATKNLYIAENRNKLVEQFLAEGSADWLWVLDTDIKFAPDTCARLLEVAHPEQAPIVAGAYWGDFEDDGYALTWHAATPEGLRLFRRLPEHGQPIELGSCGMGCTLIHRSAFEKLAEVHKDDEWKWFGHDVIPGLPDRAGEDVTFCVRARAAGLRVVGHCGVVVDHYKRQFVPHGDRITQQQEVLV